MLTAKENMREVIRGGKPDRFVNQFEAIALLFHPYLMTQPLLQRGMENVVNGWGVTNSFPKGTPGSFPGHTPDKIVVKDIEDWNSGKIPVAVIHPASAGHGLNLQSGGSTLIWFGLTWSLELYQQTNARLWRQGQVDRTVVIQHIITKGTIDERILKALSHKELTQNALIDAVKANL